MGNLHDCQTTVGFSSLDDRSELLDDILWRAVRVHAGVSCLLRIPHITRDVSEDQDTSLAFTPELV